MTLSDTIARAFAQAWAESDFEIAEKLLQAIELLDLREPIGPDGEPLRAQAYRLIAAHPASRLVSREHNPSPL